MGRYLGGGASELVGEFIETETGKGADALAKRPQLRAAPEACRKSGAKLLIAKLDRLARNVHFITGLMEAAKGNGRNSVKFVACDMPEVNDLTIHIMAAFAEHEAKRISERTLRRAVSASAWLELPTSSRTLKCVGWPLTASPASCAARLRDLGCVDCRSVRWWRN